jgi:catechol 2,3-dioxygenase-like lactoylglutathione lyase family enzyme
MSNKVEGLHHLALCTADMKSQIEFFTDKLGMELQAPVLDARCGKHLARISAPER